MRTCITPQVKGWFSAKRVQDPEATPRMIYKLYLLQNVFHFTVLCLTLLHPFSFVFLQMYQKRVKVILLNIGGFINYDRH